MLSVIRTFAEYRVIPKLTEITMSIKSITDFKGLVHAISGSEDTQDADDVENLSSFAIPFNNSTGGACTASFLGIAYRYPSGGISWVDCIQKMRHELYSMGFTQTPQLTSSRLIDSTEPMIITANKGRRYAVLVGINYTGRDIELQGCHNDIYRMEKFLIDIQGFVPNDIIKLIDDTVSSQPSRANILNVLSNTVNKLKNGDLMIFHYSGHGSRIMDNGVYVDTLVPLDYDVTGQLTTNDMGTILSKRVPYGAMLFALVDCCHSGSVLMLPYRFVVGLNKSRLIEDGVNSLVTHQFGKFRSTRL